MTAHRAGRLDEAEQLYHAVLAGNPNEANALHLLGVAHRQRGRPTVAVALITQALQHAPDLADAHANLGNAYSDMQRFDAAADCYATARRLGGAGMQTRLLTALLAAAEVHRDAGHPAEARTCLLRALNEAPDRVDVIQALLPLCLDDDLLGALALAERAWRLAPGEASFGTVWDLANRAGQDVPHARDFLAAAPDDPLRMLALGNALRRARQGWKAEAVYRTAIGLAPDLPFPAFRLACLMLEQGRTDAADALLRQIEASDLGRVQAMQFGSQFFRRLRRRALPPAPDGFSPHPCTADLVVFAACDGVYFERFASALLNSVQRNAGVACQFHLHVVNPPDDLADRIAAYRSMLGGPVIAVSIEHIDTVAWNADLRRTWFACARFRLLPHLMEAYAAPVLMLDTDLLVLHDLTGLLEAMAEGDISLVVAERHKCEPWNWLSADVAFFNATAAALACADLVARYIDYHLQEERAHWFLDQIALTACILAGFRDQAGPRLVALPPDIHRLALISADGSEEAPGAEVLFWSAHASTVDTALTLDMPQYQDYVLPWPPAPLEAEAVLDPSAAPKHLAEAEAGADAEATTEIEAMTEAEAAPEAEVELAAD
ncbi:MAG: tetratricopeptide repeat protein [Acetobacteraceae bacterium]|nr:tetratricopeptide repeat protein [Acetobacteraceae bacterium]